MESTRKKQAYANGYVYVEVHVQIGAFGFLYIDEILKITVMNLRQQLLHDIFHIPEVT